MNTFSENTFTIDCTGDACVGDTILFTEAVFEGSFRKPKFVGERRVAAVILKDSYGGEKQQHTGTIKIIWSDGFEPLVADKTTTRKFRNIYRNSTHRQPWGDESKRKEALNEKHLRGDEARVDRAIRKNQF